MLADKFTHHLMGIKYYVPTVSKFSQNKIGILPPLLVPQKNIGNIKEIICFIVI